LSQILSPLHRPRQLDFSFAGEQGDPADLAQIHPDRVIETGCGWVEGWRRRSQVNDGCALFRVAYERLLARLLFKSQVRKGQRRVAIVSQRLRRRLRKLFEKLLKSEDFGHAGDRAVGGQVGIEWFWQVVATIRRSCRGIDRLRSLLVKFGHRAWRLPGHIGAGILNRVA
jgi:hypothetical protein